MNEKTPRMKDLEQKIQDLTLATDGVERLFPVDPAWRAALKSTLSRATGQDPASPAVVDLRHEQEAPTARLRIGVTGSVPAPEVARNVSSRVRQLLSDAFPGEKAKLTIEICAIGDGTQAHPPRRDADHTLSPVRKE